MGFFEKVGRGTEKLKQRMTDAAAEGAMFECANCGAELFTEPDACPECGSDAIVERVDEGAGAHESETEDAVERDEPNSGAETDAEDTDESGETAGSDGD